MDTPGFGEADDEAHAAVARAEFKQAKMVLLLLDAGAGVRVAYLLVAMALVQLICPLLFADGVQWVVSAGVLFGYGSVLFRQLKQRLAAARG